MGFETIEPKGSLSRGVKAFLKVYIDRSRTSQLASYLFYHPSDCPACFKPHSSGLHNSHISLHNKTDEYFHVCQDCFADLERLGISITRFKKDDWIMPETPYAAFEGKGEAATV